MKRRRGVSLLEVMFSMGVIVIGLLGVTAVIPVAMEQVGQGRVLDRAARMGENASEEFLVRGMANYRNWRFASGTSVSSPQLAGWVIDPQFVSVNGATVSAPYDSRWFPYYEQASANDLRMARLTLASPATGVPTIRASEAERIFTLQDELVFSIPEEDLVPPIQDFGGGASRMYEGTMSWIATLAPAVDASMTQRNSFAEFTGSNPIHDPYRLSIIIFDSRDPSMSMDGFSERMLEVDSFPGSGLGGGDVILETQGAKSTEPTDLIDIKSGDWMMLMGNLSSMPLFRWYRVIHADSDPIYDANTMTFKLDVTLDGADWPAGISTRAIYMPNVVAVQERTISIQTSSLWTDIQGF